MPADPPQRKLPFELQPGEAVLAFVRRHWLYFSLRMAGIVLAGVGGTAVAVAAVLLTFGFRGWPGLAAGVVIAAWVGYWAVRGYFTWYRYQHDIWVVTNQRLVDSLKRHWFHHEMASTDLVDVEDLRVERHGVLQTVFDFGDVQCQTAGVVQNFVLRGIPAPAKLLAVVDGARDAARRALGAAEGLR
ncbi:MAG: hypothetical protein KatS3mg062_0512 [Tepidiforma sp.]|nr:MAG: hypothetical protein KatS3mg062_0512 [Tepidiforma sp.]